LKCPYCSVRGGLMETHRHLLDNHVDQVQTILDAESGKMQYLLDCPFCELDYMQEVNPRGRNPRFLEEFKSEIAMVAFDQLLYHIIQEHPAQVDVDPEIFGQGNESAGG